NQTRHWRLQMHCAFRSTSWTRARTMSSIWLLPLWRMLARAVSSSQLMHPSTASVTSWLHYPQSTELPPYANDGPGAKGAVARPHTTSSKATCLRGAKGPTLPRVPGGHDALHHHIGEIVAAAHCL